MTGRQRLLIATKLTLATILLWWLTDAGALDLTLIYASMGHIWALLLALAMTLLAYWAAALRWRQLLGAQRIFLRVRHATRLTFLGLFLNSFLPGGGVGGDVVRIAYVLKAAPKHKSGAILASFADRVLGVYGLMAVACLLLLLHRDAAFSRWELTFLAATALSVVCGLPLTLLAFYLGLRRSRRLRRFMGSVPAGFPRTVLHRLLESAVLFHRAPRAIVKAFALTLIISCTAVAALSLLAYVLLPGAASLEDYAFAAPWAWIANILPLTPGGLGVGEAAFDRICHWLAPSSAAAAYGTVFLLYRLVTLVAALPGLIGYVMYHESIKAISLDPKAT